MLLLAALAALSGAAWWSWSRMPPSVDQLQSFSPERLSAYVRENPTDDRAWLVLGESLLESEQVAEATTAFRTALQLDPNSPAAGAGLGLAVGLGGDPVRADAMLRELRAGAPGRPEPLLGLARLHLRAGNPNLAKDLLDRVVREHPEAPEGWYHRGVLAGSLGHYAAAEESFRRAEALSPRTGRYFRAHADLKIFLNERDPAVTLARQALQLSPWDARCRLVLGRALWLARDPASQAEGEKEIRQALSMVPGWLHPRLELAKRDLGQGQLEPALKELEKLNADFPDSKEIRYQLAQVYYRTGKRADGDRIMERYRKDLNEDNRYKEDELQSFAQPDNADLHRRVARYCVRRGVVLGAVMHYREVLRLKPGDREASTSLKALTGGRDAAKQ